MARRARRGRIVATVFSLLWIASSAFASPIPSKATAPASAIAQDSPDASRADRAAIQASLDRREVADALAAHGLSRHEVELRVAQLSPQDLSALAAHLNQIQAAGNVPNYIWILLAILIGVTIVATVF
jgi:hypothetical protein